MAVSTLRSFRIRLTGLFLLCVLALATLFAPGASAEQSQVRLLELDGPITPVMANYVRHGIQDAERARDNAIVLRMNTPGGLSSAMDDIVQDILGSPVPVVVYVAPEGARAASAGVYITYAAQVAAMAPSTTIGSATPVFLNQSGQPQNTDDAMTKKVVNDAVTKLQGLAKLRDRNADWAADAVRQAGNITAAEAVQMNVVNLVAPDLPALLNTIDGRPVAVQGGEVTLQTRHAEVVTDQMNVGERFLQIVSNPSVAYILLSLGLLGLFLEFAHPGAYLPGVLGGLFALLGLFSLGSLDVNWAGILLMGFAFLLFGIDVYVSSHGALTIGGIASFALGSLILANSTADPVSRIPITIVITMSVLLAAFFLFIVSSVIRSRLRRTITGKEGIIGAVGTVRRALEPEGMIFVDGELWRASSPVSPVAVGTRVRVVAIDGLHLTVVPLEVEPAALQPA